MREGLEFDGRRFLSARVAALAPAVVQGEPPPLVVEVSGEGRSYQVNHVQGWWRDFAQVRPHDERAVLSFIQRRGDPAGVLAPGHRLMTSEWRGLIAILRNAALAWAPRDGLNVSGYGEGSANPAEARDLFLRSLPHDWESDLGVTYDGLVPVVRANSLRAYMIAAAAASLRERVPMRVCAHCTSWFNLNHSRAEYCSASCRAASANQKVSPHGFR